MTPTTLLYLGEVAGNTFEATVVAVDREASTVTLDATAFYPTGGHQHCDQGRIEKDRSTYAVITDVKMDEQGHVVHTYAALRGDLKAGDAVTGSIHGPRRLHHAQLHTAQHLFSRFALDRFGVGTGRADFSPSGGLAVMNEPLDWEQLILIEDDVNRVIRSNVRVSRRIDGERVTVCIDGLDENPCRGTHVQQTSEIGHFKLTSVDNRVLRYETGENAKRIATRLGNHAMRAAEKLQLGNTRELGAAIEELVEQRAAAEHELMEWRTKTTARELAKAYGRPTTLASGTVLFSVELSHLKAKDARDYLRKELVQQDQVWLCLTERRSVLVASSTEHFVASEVIAEFMELWGIRGGGNKRFAQGGPVGEDIAAPLDEIARWLSAANHVA